MLQCRAAIVSCNLFLDRFELEVFVDVGLDLVDGCRLLVVDEEAVDDVM